jgi:hypothetical protein
MRVDVWRCAVFGVDLTAVLWVGFGVRGIHKHGLCASRVWGLAKNSTGIDRKSDSLSITVELFHLRIFSLGELLPANFYM